MKTSLGELPQIFPMITCSNAPGGVSGQFTHHQNRGQTPELKLPPRWPAPTSHVCQNIFDGAMHFFINERLPSYEVDAAREVFVRTLEFLRRTLA